MVVSIIKLIKNNIQSLNYFKEEIETKINLIAEELLFKGRARQYTFEIISQEVFALPLLKIIFNMLKELKSFKDSGFYKVLIITIEFTDGSIKTLHPNICISNKTTYLEYYKLIKEYINSFFEPHYNFDIKLFRVIVWNMDLYANKKIQITESTIKIEDLNTHINKMKKKIISLKILIFLHTENH